jgi:hypothetical protein
MEDLIQSQVILSEGEGIDPRSEMVLACFLAGKVRGEKARKSVVRSRV